MKCKNLFCIYWNENKCILNEISLDIGGNCEACIYTNINDLVLEAYRKETLEKLKS